MKREKGKEGVREGWAWDDCEEAIAKPESTNSDLRKIMPFGVSSRSLLGWLRRELRGTKFLVFYGK